MCSGVVPNWDMDQASLSCPLGYPEPRHTQVCSSAAVSQVSRALHHPSAPPGITICNAKCMVLSGICSATLRICIPHMRMYCFSACYAPSCWPVAAGFTLARFAHQLRRARPIKGKNTPTRDAAFNIAGRAKLELEDRRDHQCASARRQLT